MNSDGVDFADEAVRAAFQDFPEPAREGLLELRELILKTALQTPEVGPLLEALRWGQPAYLTPKSKSGTTIRLGVPKTGGFALFVHCQTSLIEDFKASVGSGYRFEGSRAVLFEDPSGINPDKLQFLISHALTYHLKRSSAG